MIYIINTLRDYSISLRKSPDFVVGVVNPTVPTYTSWVIGA